MKNAMLAIIKKDFRGVTSNKNQFSAMLIVPLVLTILLPSVFVFLIHFVPEDPDIQTLVELLPPSAREGNLELTVVGLILNFILPAFFLMIPIMRNSGRWRTSSGVSGRPRGKGTGSCRFRCRMPCTLMITVCLHPMRIS